MALRADLPTYLVLVILLLISMLSIIIIVIIIGEHILPSGNS
jgi:hypothetical protein